MGSGAKKLRDSSLILDDELHKLVIKKFNKRKVYSQFKDNIWGVDLYAEKVYSQTFTAVNKKFVLILHYNGYNTYLFVNGKEELKFKAKDDQIVKEILCLGNISYDWTAANVGKTGFWGEIYDFAVDYTNASVSDIYNVHRYLMKKHNT